MKYVHLLFDSARSNFTLVLIYSVVLTENVLNTFTLLVSVLGNLDEVL